jgi:prephenate dehydratase
LTAYDAEVPLRLTYLGPPGTFSEAALRTLPEAVGAEVEPAPSVVAALDAVRSGQVDAALVPFENSVEGAVPATLDELSAGPAVHIQREVLLPVRFALLGRPGTTLAQVGTVSGHPHAQPQCRHWLSANLPGRAWRPAASNADAARDVSQGHVDAALAGAFAAEQYGLEVLAHDVHDVEGAVTRFVLVGPPRTPPPATGADRTTVVAYERDDHPGALLEMLTEFAVRGVNLTRLESRPTGHGLGSYCFSLDCEGHIGDARVGEALSALHRICADVRFLGSYPRADGKTPSLRLGVADENFAAAEQWLSGIREGDGLVPAPHPTPDPTPTPTPGHSSG